MDADALLREIDRLACELPTPHPSWHRYVPEIRALTAILLAAGAAIRSLPEAQEELVRQVAGEADYPPDDAGGPVLASARRQLRLLPLPSGEHPFLDEIRPTYEAAEAALAALAVTEDGEAAFAAAAATAF